MHDATKVLMGQTQSSDKNGSEVFASSPLTFPAGTAVRRDLNGALSVTKAAGRWIGISMGKSLSDTLKTEVIRAGLRVPILLEAAPARGIVEITDYAKLVDTTNDTLKVGATTFTFKTSASLEGEVLCAASASSNSVVAAALVAKINAHSVAGPLFIASAVGAVVTITAKNNATAGSAIDLVYTSATGSTDGLTVDDITFTGGAATAADYVAIGQKAYISDTTGKADDVHSASTLSDATYVSGVMTGIDEAGNEVAVALVDMVGGL